MEKHLANRKIIVLAEDLYEDLELWYPALRFREEGATVVIAGTDAKTYHGKHGYPVTVDTGSLQTPSRPLSFPAAMPPIGFAGISRSSDSSGRCSTKAR